MVFVFQVCYRLYECMTFMRKTVDGILACTNTRGNVWNVFGGLGRTKKAVCNILTHELRPSHNYYTYCITTDIADERDSIMV